MEEAAGGAGGESGGVLGGVELSAGLSPLDDEDEDGGADAPEPELAPFPSSSAPSNFASSLASSVSSASSAGSLGCLPFTQRGYESDGDGRAYLVTKDEERLRACDQACGLQDARTRWDDNKDCLVRLSDDAVVDRIAPASGFIRASVPGLAVYVKVNRTGGGDEQAIHKTQSARLERMRHVGSLLWLCPQLWRVFEQVCLFSEGRGLQ